VNVVSLEEEVRLALQKVIDPETSLSVMRMDLIHNIEVTPDGSVSLVFRPSSPMCPMAYSLGNSIKKAVESVRGTSSVEIHVENFNGAAHLESLLRSCERADRKRED